MTADGSSEGRKYAIYVLGAGFSVPAGIPAADELWREILARGLAMTGRAAKFRDDLDEYLRYRLLCDGVELTYETINLEELMGFLDVEHHLGLRGKDTWSDAGNEGQIVIKTLIGQILTERTPAAGRVPDLYVEFARRLRPDDCVLTFNYDLLLERALEQAGVPYRLFPDRYTNVSDFGATLDESRDEVVVLKVHGSVDWFDDRRYQRFRRTYEVQGFDPNRAGDYIFNPSQGWSLTPVVDGARRDDDPMVHLYRLRQIEAYYRDPDWFLNTPSLISPSTQKLVYSSYVRAFWNGLGRAGVGNSRLVIIGYSLPKHDDYARQVLYEIARNYQTPNDWAEYLKIERDPLMIVDFRCDAAGLEELRQRYAFVDWSSAVLHSTGFDMSVVERL
jgi:hypothetical protein